MHKTVNFKEFYIFVNTPLIVYLIHNWKTSLQIMTLNPAFILFSIFLGGGGGVCSFLNACVDNGVARGAVYRKADDG